MTELRKLGLLGGLSWHSTLNYYRNINTAVERELGGYRSAPLLMASVDFAPIVEWQLAKEWDKAGDHLADLAVSLQNGGVEAVMICSNTMHKVADQIADRVNIPLLHIATAIANDLKRRGESKATLIGTRYTMNDNFLYDALAVEGILAVPPSVEHKRAINEAIFKRLVFGRVTIFDQTLLNDIISASQESGSGSVILGCTEIALLVNQDTPKELIVDSTVVHSRMASDFVLS